MDRFVHVSFWGSAGIISECVKKFVNCDLFGKLTHHLYWRHSRVPYNFFFFFLSLWGYKIFIPKITLQVMDFIFKHILVKARHYEKIKYVLNLNSVGDFTLNTTVLFQTCRAVQNVFMGIFLKQKAITNNHLSRILSWKDAAWYVDQQANQI